MDEYLTPANYQAAIADVARLEAQIAAIEAMQTAMGIDGINADFEKTTETFTETAGMLNDAISNLTWRRGELKKAMGRYMEAEIAGGNTARRYREEANAP